jgi:hypothetical protein
MVRIVVTLKRRVFSNSPVLPVDGFRVKMCTRATLNLLPLLPPLLRGKPVHSDEVRIGGSNLVIELQLKHETRY